ncbi:MAG: 50S ribosomal protein L25 [Candidatus Komeilibacteria bacterium]|nr:50S ribosomal protein L25 [Candidatus Komeilibacteria bacterium]
MAIKLESTTRQEVGKAVKAFRRQEKVPAVVYGFGQDNLMLWLNKRQLDKVFTEAGTFSVVDLLIDDKDSTKVIIKEAQRDAVTDNIIHVDLFRINLQEKIEVQIPIHFVGEAPAVKSLGGTAIHALDTITIECLPEDLIKDVQVDISSLETFDDVIHVGDIKVPEKVTIINETDQVVVSVAPPRVEEAETVPAEGEVKEAEVIGEKKEGEETEDKAEAGK